MYLFKVITTGALTVILITPFSSCKKIGFLNEQTSSELYVPGTLEELEYLFNDENTMNRWPGLGEISSDNYYLKYNSWQQLSATKRNAHIWAQEIYENDKVCDDWQLSTKQILTANVVLERHGKISAAGNQTQWNNLKGKALFFRSCAFFNLAQLFAPPFDSATAKNDLGIPLRLTGNIDENPRRSSVKQTYDRIISDLQTAAQLLGPIDRTRLNQPSRAAALAMLARIYVSMNKFTQAGLYADSCLKLYNTLIHFHSLPVSSVNPLSSPNSEIIFKAELPEKTDPLIGLTLRGSIIDSVLYKSYHPNDLRQQVFFLIMTDGLPHNKKSYAGSIIAFCGLATDEMYLIRAESHARANRLHEAMADLNTLLQKRWKEGTYVDLKTHNKDTALKYILEERRKELPFRGVRWTDLRRLNKIGPAITATRIVNGIKHELRPNSHLYVLPIPKEVVNFSGIEQNPR